MSASVFNGIMVAIPAYNAVQTLERVLREVLEYVDAREVVVVDDGSTDSTFECASRAGVKVLRHERNRGKGAALQTAFAYVREHTSARGLISLDADGQHLPQELPKFAAAFAEAKCKEMGAIIGCRSFHPSVMPLPRIMSNRMTSALLSWKIGQKIEDSQCGYRLYSRKLIDQVYGLQTSGYETESEILIQGGRAGLKFYFIPIATVYAGEKSHIRGARDIARFVSMYLQT